MKVFPAPRLEEGRPGGGLEQFLYAGHATAPHLAFSSGACHMTALPWWRYLWSRLFLETVPLRRRAGQPGSVVILHHSQKLLWKARAF